ncbi:MAG TPA: ATP cone domain-containing protein [Verrucomicrobiae bacterium]|nr:ATP cone domain-containing protein [Verrucomicrobiae bacterium]
MIQSLEDILWVQDADGRLAPFDERRLAVSIQKAAESVGQRDWWLAESIAAAVHAFGLKSRRDPVIPSEEISEIVTEVLATLGYEWISEAYDGGVNRVAIHLNDLVWRTDGGFELEFFRQLDHALGAAANHQLIAMRIDGLRACVMQLRGARRWTAGCRRLAEEIVEHVRGRVARMRPLRAANLKLAVME